MFMLDASRLFSLASEKFIGSNGQCLPDNSFGRQFGLHQRALETFKNAVVLTAALNPYLPFHPVLCRQISRFTVLRVN